MQSRSHFTEFLVHCTNMFDSSLGYQDIEVVKGVDIEIKIVYLVKGHPTHAQLKYNGTWIKGLSIAKIN